MREGRSLLKCLKYLLQLLWMPQGNTLDNFTVSNKRLRVKKTSVHSLQVNEYPVRQ